MAAGSEKDGVGAVVLENTRVAVAFNENRGAVRSIRDKQLDLTCEQEGIGWEIATDRGTIRAERAAGVKRIDDGLMFPFYAKACLRSAPATAGSSSRD